MKGKTKKPVQENPYRSKPHEFASMEDWEREGLRRFGDDKLNWRFVCPLCGIETFVFEWRDAGAEEGAAAFSCVGRWRGAGPAIVGNPGPCNYAGGGLFRLNPTAIRMESGEIHQVFNFAEEKCKGG